MNSGKVNEREHYWKSTLFPEHFNPQKQSSIRMILRAKFKTRQSQKEYFDKIKKELSVSIRRLANLLDVSDGGIESYCCGRTAPPVWIIKRLEKLTGIIANYVKVKGKVIRKKRGLSPMILSKAKKILKRYFSNQSEQILCMIEEGHTISDIVEFLRKQSFKFDNSLVTRAIGAYKKELLISIWDKIPKEACVVVKGKVYQSKGDYYINFNLKPLADLIENNGELRVKIAVSKDRRDIKIFPFKHGRKIAFQDKWRVLKMHIPTQLDIHPNNTVDIIIPVEEFGLDFFDCIYDKDAIMLARKAVEKKMSIFPIRSTPNNRLGDLVFEIGNKIVIVEITRALSRSCAHFKIGQILMQKISHLNKNPIQFLVCKKSLFREKQKEALRFLQVTLIHTDFEEGWENRVLTKLLSHLGNSDKY